MHTTLPNVSGLSKNAASYGLVSPIWRDQKSTPPGFEANASTSSVKSISQQKWNRASFLLNLAMHSRTSSPLTTSGLM